MKAKIELAKRELSRRKLVDFIKYNFQDYDVNWHHEVIADKLEKVESGAITRLMLFLPPRHGKSELGSVQFPAWFLGRNPKKEVICSSYTSDLAVDFGRRVRNLVGSIEYKNLFGLTMSEDSAAANKWKTSQGGGYVAVGVGGPTTGRGADVFIIDDPFKNRKEADSPLIREQAWKWYISTVYTRLSSTGAVILINCMVGDTNVLMDDGTNKFLKDIRIGDRIKTYDNGKLSTSTIKNHTSQGRDLCFTITTSSGKVVKANARHPFLTYYNGKLKWTRVRDLTTTHQIVTLKDSGENGKGKRASQTDANSRSVVGGIAPLTTTKKSGLMGTVRRRLTTGLVVMGILNIVTGLRSRITKNFLLTRKDCVQFVDGHRSPIVTKDISVSTTAMKLKKSEVYYATTVTSVLEDLETKKLCCPHWDTSDFTLDNIISIKESGVEEVFDIEVDRTHNFIANLVISRNTRWHDDDLAGRLLAQKEGDKWDVVSFPAIAINDEKVDGKFFRKAGEALWPNRFPLARLEQTRSVLGSYDWASLYQQTPIDAASVEFLKDWFKVRTEEEVEKLDTRRFLTIDTAGPMTSHSDYMGFVDNRVDREGNWNVKGFKYKISSADLIELMFSLQDLYHYEKIGIEKTIYLDSLKPFLDMEMMKRKKPLPIFQLRHSNMSKELRVRGLVPRYQAGKIYHIDGQCFEMEPQLLRFPKGKEDDIIDALAYQDQVADVPFGFDMGSEDAQRIKSNSFDRFSPIGSF